MTERWTVPCGCDFHGDHLGCDEACRERGCSHEIGAVVSTPVNPDLVAVRFDPEGNGNVSVRHLPAEELNRLMDQAVRALKWEPEKRCPHVEFDEDGDEEECGKYLGHPGDHGDCNACAGFRAAHTCPQTSPPPPISLSAKVLLPLLAEVAEFRAECDKVGVPYNAAGLVRHHTNGSKMTAQVWQQNYKTVKAQLDELKGENA